MNAIMSGADLFSLSNRGIDFIQYGGHTGSFGTIRVLTSPVLANDAASIAREVYGWLHAFVCITRLMTEAPATKKLLQRFVMRRACVTLLANAVVPPRYEALPQHTPARILVVDDHGESRRIMVSILKRWGHTVVEADSYTHALAATETFAFDILISDIEFAGEEQDGADLVAALKAQRPIKAIAITGRSSEADRRRHIAAGFDFHLTKPISSTALSEKIIECQRG